MNPQVSESSAKLKKGILFSCLSLTILPIGSFFGMLGMCSGPNSASGAVIVFVLGIGGLAAAGYGAFCVVRTIRFEGPVLKVGGFLSLGASALAAMFGAVYALAASDALMYYFGRR
jgi:hypothetical protein